MNLAIVCGSGNPALADAIADTLGTRVCRSSLIRFPDSELEVEIGESVRGCDTYIIQPTGPEVDAHVTELLFLADACRRAGAARLTGIIPYFGYARQDRRAKGRGAVGGRVIADMIGVAGFNRIVGVDLHTVSLEGFFNVPLEHLSAVALLANMIEESVSDKTVIVAPDLGAAKLAERYAEILRRPIAVTHKIRLSGEEVKVHGIVGEVKGRVPVIVDDMISTAGTVAAAAEALLAAGCAPEISIAATHGLLVGPAIDRLSRMPLKRLLVTDSLPVSAPRSLPLKIVSIASILAEAISRLNVGESMDDLLTHR
jgi:ribose-phosphate pyrophosphokinase